MESSSNQPLSDSRAYPVFPLLFKPLLKLVDLLLQDVDSLSELGGRQLLFLIITRSKG